MNVQSLFPIEKGNAVYVGGVLLSENDEIVFVLFDNRVYIKYLN
jgi:hypothetical protein